MLALDRVDGLLVAAVGTRVARRRGIEEAREELVGQSARLGTQLQQLGTPLGLETLDLARAERGRAHDFAEQIEGSGQVL